MNNEKRNDKNQSSIFSINEGCTYAVATAMTP